MTEKYQQGILLTSVGAPSLFDKKETEKFYRRYLSNRRIQSGNRLSWGINLRFGLVSEHTDSYLEKIDYLKRRQGRFPTADFNKITSTLERSFNERVKIIYGGCYDQQNIQSALEKLKLFGCSELYILPLYPQSSHITSGVVHDVVDHSLRKLKWDIDRHFIDNYHDNPYYIKAVAASIKHAGFDTESDDRLLFSYQSIPITDIEAGDTFELQTGATSLQIASELGIDRNRWTIGYQSPFDTQRKWLTPSSTEVITRWAETGTGRVFFVCPGHAMETIETLYDVKHHFKSIYNETRKKQGKAYGNGEYTYTPCLDLTKAHIKVLSHVLQPYIEEN